MVAALEKSLLGRSSFEALTAQDAELRTAYLLGVRETVSRLERAEIERMEDRESGGIATRGKAGWFSKLLQALWDSDTPLPSNWVELRGWIEGAGADDLAAAGVHAVRVEDRPGGDHVVAEMPDGHVASVSRPAAMRAAARLRKAIQVE